MKHHIPRPTSYLAAALLSALPGYALADFIPLGDLPGGAFGSNALGVSANGGTVVGSSSATFQPVVDEAYRWTEATGMVDLGTLPGYTNSRALSVSGDGSVVVGYNFRQPDVFEAFRWTPTTGMTSLGSPGTLVSGVSADGNVVAGQSVDGRALRWTEATGFVDIGAGAANSISSDGSVMVGVNNSLAFRWKEATGQISLGTLPGGTESVALDVSADGAVVVGTTADRFTSQAFRWTQATGMAGLGFLPGGDPYTAGRAVSADGRVIVGESSSLQGALGNRVFIWDEANGMRDLREVLIAQGDDLEGWRLAWATDVSADGRTIVGWGFNPEGQTEGWLARLAPASQSVTIDIKPGSLTNSINLRSKGKIPVAILSTEDFDATTVDPDTVHFGRSGTEADPVHFALADVDRDGNTDMLLHFRTRQTGIQCGDTSALLEGKTIEGQLIEGSDSIKTVGCH